MTTTKRQKKIIKGTSDATNELDPMSSLKAKLQSYDPEIYNYIIALEEENLKLQKQIAKLRAENVTLNNRVKVLEEEEFKPKLNIEIVDYSKHNTPDQK